MPFRCTLTAAVKVAGLKNLPHKGILMVHAQCIFSSSLDMIDIHVEIKYIYLKYKIPG